MPTNGQIEVMQAEVREWITGLLPVRDPSKTCIKLVTEAAELLDSIANEGIDPKSIPAEEIADVFILLIDIADQLGVNLHAAFNSKMAVNRNRTWKIKNGSLTHTS